MRAGDPIVWTLVPNRDGQRLRHVHIGAGALGLGLVVPLTADDLDVTLVQRRSSRSRRIWEALDKRGSYCRHAADGATPTTRVTLSPSSEILDADDADRLRARVRAPETTLLTTAVGEANLEELAVGLRSVLSERARAGGPPLCVIACENTVGPIFTALSHAFEGTTVEFARCVVDRFCRKPEVRDGDVHVSTEAYGSWLIEAGPSSRVLVDALGHLDEVGFVRDLGPLRRKKRWLVNAPHFALALEARARGIDQIDTFVQGEGRHVLASLQRECTAALMADTDAFTGRELAAFNRSVGRRMRSLALETDRVLRRFESGGSAAATSVVDELLVEPLQRYLRAYGVAPEALTRAAAPYRTLLPS